MKRVLLAGVAAAVLFGLAGSAQAADKKTLVFVVNGASDFWKAAEAGVKKAQGELRITSSTSNIPNNRLRRSRPA